VSLICLLGYTVLPFMVLTPVAFLSTKYGFTGIVIFGATFTAGMVWMLYLLMRALEAVYIIDFIRAFAVVCFSVLMLGIVFVVPVYLAVRMVLLQLAP
jgi:hypothetical protein